jgi:hypothetical protein
MGLFAVIPLGLIQPIQVIKHQMFTANLLMEFTAGFTNNLIYFGVPHRTDLLQIRWNSTELYLVGSAGCQELGSIRTLPSA